MVDCKVAKDFCNCSNRLTLGATLPMGSKIVNRTAQKTASSSTQHLLLKVYLVVHLRYRRASTDRLTQRLLTTVNLVCQRTRQALHVHTQLTGIGYDCAGHNKLKSRPCGLSIQLIRSFTSTLGATLPMGSLPDKWYWVCLAWTLHSIFCMDLNLHALILGLTLPTGSGGKIFMQLIRNFLEKRKSPECWFNKLK
uniref:Uncharacterized protein n=1 Tax=Glossina austeni TaxID=7395 RepID=A0A1A9V527_GLOAU